ncbi:MAG: DUF1217 domain-containing protein [Methylobacterium frigidaeris]
MVSTFTNYALIAKDLTASLKRKAAEPLVARETAYFEANIGKVKTVDEFLADTRLYSYAMKAYGLEDMIYAKAFMRRVLNEGVEDSSSFANRLTDSRYRAFAKAFNLAAGWGARGTGEGAAYNAFAPSASDAKPATATGSRVLTATAESSGLYDFSTTNEVSFTLTTNLDADTSRTGKIVLNAATLAGRVPDLARVTADDIVRAVNAQIDATGDAGLKGTVRAALDADGRLVFTTTNVVDLGADGRVGGTGRDADRTYAATGADRTILIQNTDRSSPTQTGLSVGFGIDSDPDTTARASAGAPARATGSRIFAAGESIDFSTTNEVSFELTTNLDAATARTVRIVLNAATLRGSVADLAKVTPDELVKAINARIDASGNAGLKGAVAASLGADGRLVFTTTDFVALGADGKEGGIGGNADTAYAAGAPGRTILIRNTDRSTGLQSAVSIGFGIDDDPDTRVQAKAATAGSAAQVTGARLFAATDTLDFSATNEVSFTLTTSLDADTSRTGTIVLNAATLKGVVADLAKVTPAEVLKAIDAQIAASGNAGLQGAVAASLDAAGRLVFTTADTLDLGGDGRLGGVGANADRAYGAVGAGRTIQLQNINRSAATQTGLDVGFGIDNGPDAAVKAATAAYMRQALESDAGEEDTGARLALYFARLGPTLTSGYQILGDTALTQVVNTVLGLSSLSGASAEALASRARLIEQKIDLESFSDPGKLDAFVRRFAAVWDAQNSAASSPLLALFGSSSASGIGASLLLSAVRVRTGG